MNSQIELKYTDIAGGVVSGIVKKPQLWPVNCRTVRYNGTWYTLILPPDYTFSTFDEFCNACFVATHKDNDETTEEEFFQFVWDNPMCLGANTSLPSTN